MRSLYDDTIVAPATAAGAAGLAVVRLSGPQAIPIAARLFDGADLTASDTHRAHHGWIVTPEGERLDEVLALVLRAPRSYTGEDTVEFSCHGSPQVVDELVDAAVQGGARLAEPGEFTRRAFLNGKLDLVQAEAVADLIQSHSRAARRAALEQLRGRLSERLQGTRQAILDILGDIEASIDFVEEGIEFFDRERVVQGAATARAQIEALIATASDGVMLRSGVRVCLAGAPNVGKSSLFNRILRSPRSIVTSHPGTTRDVVSETIRIGGLTVVLEDTAGLRADAADPVELLGIERSRQSHAEADVIVFVLDASRPMETLERQALQELDRGRAVVVVNKVDVLAGPEEAAIQGALRVSAATGDGVDAVLDALLQSARVRRLALQNDALVTINQRHREALQAALSALDRFGSDIETSEPPEILAADLRQAVVALGEVSGDNVTEEILGSIFSRFCIGK